MKKVIRALYINPKTDLSVFTDDQVNSALSALSIKLSNELSKTYRWLAVCTVAVEAGRWGGERRRKRRVKLLSMVNQCRSRLGMVEVVPKDDSWCMVGLYYGYWASNAWSKDNNMDPVVASLVGLADSHGFDTASTLANAMGF